MKILHVLDHSIPLHSGYTFRTCSILNEQAKLGWETSQVTSIKHINPQSDEEVHDNLKFYRTKNQNGFLSKLPILNQLYVIRTLQKRLTEVIKQEKPDIIHAHSPCLNGIAAINAAKKFSIPVVYEMRASWEDAAVEHGTTTEGSLRYRLTRALETFVFKNADGITTICNGLKKDIASRSIGETPIQVIPNAVNAEEFESSDAIDENLRDKFNLGNSYIVGFIGSFYAYEGLDLFVQAMHKLRNSELNIKGLLVGGGPEDEKLRQLVKQLNLEDRIIFTGRVPHAQVDAYYYLIDVLVYHRSVKASDSVISFFNEGVSLAEEQYKPGWSVGVEYRKRFGNNADGSDRDDQMAALVKVDLPLFTDKRQDRRLSSSQYQVMAAKDVRIDQLQVLKRSVLREFAAFRKFKEQSELYDLQLVPDANANANASLKAYQSGVTEFTTLARARITQLDIQLEALRVKVEAAKAQARILYLMEKAES